MQIQREQELSSRREIAEPGAGRIGIVSGYFTLSGFLAAIGTVATTAALFVPDVPVQAARMNPVAAPVILLLTAIGFFRTSRLLDRRQKSGAHLAALCFLTPLVGYLTGAAPSLSTLAFAGIGLGLVASVWRHLE